jgi:predicted metal-dependent enzyme (double-stranded beta helix superfamily)
MLVVRARRTLLALGGTAVFNVDELVSDCLAASTDPDPQRAVRETLVRLLEKPARVSEVLGEKVGGINVIYNSPELTVLNVIWAPHMKLLPHDHQMWALIGIYGGAEDNALFRRGPEKIQRAGGRLLRDGDVMALGTDAIHSVTNPERRFTGAIHVYGGDFVNQPRSQWDPDSLIEKPYDYEQIRRAFAAANDQWASQAGQDLDESAF